MQRVLVIGCSGAGKSTFSRALAARTGLPPIHLDAEYWRPDWTMPPKLEWRATLTELLARPAWIMDGNFDASLDVRLPRADTVVWFDLSRHVCLRRALGRVISTRGRVRPDMGPGCPERFDLEFLRWIWNFDRTVRPKIQAAIARHGTHAETVVLRTDAQVAACLDRSARAGASP